MNTSKTTLSPGWSDRCLLTSETAISAAGRLGKRNSPVDMQQNATVPAPHPSAASRQER